MENFCGRYVKALRLKVGAEGKFVIEISDAGLNASPRHFDTDSGLNNNPKKNGLWRKKK